MSDRAATVRDLVAAARAGAVLPGRGDGDGPAMNNYMQFLPVVLAFRAVNPTASIRGIARFCQREGHDWINETTFSTTMSRKLRAMEGNRSVS